MDPAVKWTVAMLCFGTAFSNLCAWITRERRWKRKMREIDALKNDTKVA